MSLPVPGSELIDRAKQRVGNRAPAGLNVAQTRAWFLDRVNAGYRALATFRDPGPGPSTGRTLRFLELHDRLPRTIAAGLTDNFIAHQAGVFSMYSLRDVTNDYNPRWYPARSLMNLDDGTPNPGKINRWTDWADGGAKGYLIWPVPSASTSVVEYVYKYPDPLTDDAADFPDIPAEWHDAIWTRAAVDAARLLGQSDNVKACLDEFLLMVRTIRLAGEETRHDRKRILVGPYTP